MSGGGGLDELRKRIDSFDTRILELLEERAGVAESIGEEKRRTAKPGEKPAFYDPERETRVLERMKSRSQGKFPQTSIPYVFKEIMSACRSLEASFRIAYLGPPGTYSEMAAHQVFGHSVEYIDVPTIEGVFDSLERRNADYGIVPFENSSGGGVTQTLDRLLSTELMFRSEHFLKIQHCAIGRDAMRRDLAAAKRVYSHPQAFAQCNAWILTNLPRAERIVANSTAAAVRSAADDPEAVAIGSRLSAENFGLAVIREGVQDQKDNSTRFVVLHAADAPITGADRTSLIVSAESLGPILAVLDADKIPVTRSQTRPDAGRSWRHHFFIDVVGHRLDPKLKKAIKKLERRADAVKVLGSYPVAR